MMGAVPARIRSTILHGASRIKRTIHAATAPRTKPAADIGVDIGDTLVRLLFPEGGSAPALAQARQTLRTEPLTAADIRRAIGLVDQHQTPSPFSVRASAGDLAYVTVGGIEVAVDVADASVSQQLLGGQPYEPHIQRVICEQLPPGGVFVDVGANIGYHTALAASLVGPDGVVDAFEPNPENARLIAHMIERNRLTNVRLRPFALSANTGFASFRSAMGSNGGFVTTIDPRDFDPTVTVVPTLALDDAVEPERGISLIKLDVEGAEPMVLAGAGRTLERCRPAVIFEFSQEMTSRVAGTPPETLFGTFTALDYRIFLIDRPTGDLVPVDPDELIESWDDWLRIEDFLAQPAERA